MSVLRLNPGYSTVAKIADRRKVKRTAVGQVLANAKTEINKLRNADHAHPERVYIQARSPVSKAAATSGMDDATTARPTDTAIRNYWLLRERLATSEQMILGLQGYIRSQCQ
ncbi:lysis protein [Xenorhabdus sp. Vera]|nr:lysis protein [Xenorhabdus sp. Vera]